MNVLQAAVDEREDQHRALSAADDLWLRERAGIDPAERLQSWDRWLRHRLQTALVWPEDAAKRDRLLGQCAAELTTLAKQLRGRGWLLDGKALAAHVDAVLGPVGKAQRQGKVGDFWPYFRAAVSRYVGLNAEEIQQHARRTGADEGLQTLSSALAGLKLQGESMVELLSRRAEEVRDAQQLTLRERQSARRAQEKADQAQLRLI
jgi:hypothetical protein